MKRKGVVLFSLIGSLFLPTWFTGAAERSAVQEISGAQQQQVYGSQLMTQEERVAYHTQMRAAKNEEEREQLRKEHHQRMQERAKIRGFILPEEPMTRGGGMGMERGKRGMMDGSNR